MRLAAVEAERFMAEELNRMLRIESRALGELAALQIDPVFHGRGVPRGDGRLVLVLPGLFGNDFYLQPLHGWLRRMATARCRARPQCRLPGSAPE